MTAEDKESLIDLIIWYRDKYHRVDCNHSELIEKIRATDDDNLLHIYEKIVDGWLDY